jgi:hypothetical protein
MTNIMYKRSFRPEHNKGRDYGGLREKWNGAARHPTKQSKGHCFLKTAGAEVSPPPYAPKKGV